MSPDGCIYTSFCPFPFNSAMRCTFKAFRTIIAIYTIAHRSFSLKMEHIPILTTDTNIVRYDVEVIW